MTRLETLKKYRGVLLTAKQENSRLETVTYLAHTDLFYFLIFVLHRIDANNDWCYARCREYQANPDGFLDLWWREGYKSTIITFAGIIWFLMNFPERTYAIISQALKIAAPFLFQIKNELETNQTLWKIAPSVFWEDPQKYAPQWSMKDGIIIRRQGNPKEASVSALGLVEGQPAGPHWTDLHYDDPVTKEGVRTPDAIKLTLEMFRLSLNLGTRGGRKRMIGTRWHYADLYGSVIEAGTFKPRIYTATKDGTETGVPWLLTPEALRQKIKDMGPYISACHLFLNPTQDSLMRFDESWLRYWSAKRTSGLNLYLLVDPASSKKKGSDYTVFILIGLGADRNYYVVDWIRDRLSLTEKANILFKWHQIYKPILVGYEKYGMQSDIEHFEDRMERDNYRFPIEPLAGPLAKVERINRLVAPYKEGRIYIPASSPYEQYDKEVVDLTQSFIRDEYRAHPFEEHDDMLDCLARVLDEDFAAVFPQGDEVDPLKIGEPSQAEEYDPLRLGA